ncbi:hypothetical protein [Ruegeria profundi]|nr:hypothetical protein [Ruegeria profundi]
MTELSKHPDLRLSATNTAMTGKVPKTAFNVLCNTTVKSHYQ